MATTRETNSDRIKEQAVCDEVGPVWKCIMERQPNFAPVDRLLTRDGVGFAWAEVKDRGDANYPTYRISFHKWMRMCQFGAWSGLPVFIVLRWRTGLIFKQVWPMPEDHVPKLIQWGRTDRDDPNDVEGTVEFPISEFKAIARSLSGLTS